MPWGKIIIALLVGIIVGGAGGYAIGFLQGKVQGLADAAVLEQMQQADEDSAAIQAQAAVQAEAALVDEEENPLGDVQTNPFE